MLKYFSVKKFSTKKISFGSNARKPLAEAVNLIKNTVKLTLGPGGRNVAIDSEYSLPKITKDGVTVAKNI
jgi:chaperonin GroEL